MQQCWLPTLVANYKMPCSSISKQDNFKKAFMFYFLYKMSV